jgi:hypothetical protein
MAENSPQIQNLLTFFGSSGFRTQLVARNLKPYVVEGAFSADENNRYFEYTLSDQSPKDAKDLNLTVFDSAKEATIVNIYGTQAKIDAADLVNSSAGAVSMQQAGVGNVQQLSSEQQVEYNFNAAELELLNEFLIETASVINRYTPENGYTYSYYTSDNILKGVADIGGEYPNFTIPDINLLGAQRIGVLNLLGISDQLSTDSYLAQISAQYIADSFTERVQREISKNTIGKVNLGAFQDVFSASLLVSGQQPLIYKNYAITIPDGVFDQAAFLIQKFTGTYIPVSPIEGSYLTEPTRYNMQPSQQLDGPNNKSTTPLTSTGVFPIKFLNNTGSGQKSALFNNLGYNKYKPFYEENTTQVGLAVDNLFNKDNNIGNTYIGSQTSDPSLINSPEALVPTDEYGNKTHTTVFGPDAMAKEFEGDVVSNIKFGPNTNAYIDDQNLTGGFTWVSPKNSQEAGQKVGAGGQTGLGVEPSFQGDVSSKFNGSKSTNYIFKSGSLLDKTQRIIDSVPASGPTRLLHVGNAMNQISKVFNDGYKEITKGSAVKRYINSGGTEIGQEYGRVFTKDSPYFSFNNLQSSVANENGEAINGNIRKSTYSVLDSTYNLNIAPTTGDESTNIKDGKVKKYMFSIENLAWRGTPEFAQLPECEKGPNGGRIMWFPPYDLTIGQESSNPQFNANKFLGRPEPIYTYESTERTASLSWSIIVDHPSVSDLVVKKVLQNESSENTVTQVLASFFAGLKKYDIYEIAQNFSTLDRNTIESAYQEILQSNNTTTDEKKQAMNDAGDTGAQSTSEDPTSLYTQFINYAFYFPPFNGGESETNYQLIYDNYLADSQYYIDGNPAADIFFSDILPTNYNKMTELRKQVIETLEENSGIIQITLNGTKILGLAGNSVQSNDWAKSVELFFGEFILSNNKTIQNYIDDKKIIFKTVDLGTIESDKILTSQGAGESVLCINPNVDSTIFSIRALGCRAIRISNISVQPIPPSEQSGPSAVSDQNVPNQNALFGQKPQSNNGLVGVGKKIIRKLLTESDYFEVIKKEDSFLYESFRKKFKFFNPLFHSITPEGLNSRLVFLNQCVRPGRTIPTKGQEPDTFLKDKDSFNTNFGSPPILVLRVGDFYNTKIVPNSLTINYEPLFDINPEGIGVQPMIAKIQLGFNMIGGHGLKGPVAKLQNALSFNYYANTEMYDERAEETESTEAVDKALINSIRNEEPLVTINNVNDTVQNEGGTTIGIVLTSNRDSNGVESGTTEYTQFFNGFVEKTKEYFNLTTNTYESFVKEYNFGTWSQVNRDRNYDEGFYDNLYHPNDFRTTIYGKPGNWETNLIVVGNIVKTNIDNGSERLTEQLELSLLTNQVKNKIKNNYKLYIDKVISEEFTSVATYIQKLTELQISFVTYMAKMDIISSYGDGKIMANGQPKPYLLTGTLVNNQESMNSFREDYYNLMNSLSSYASYVNNIIYFSGNMVSGNVTEYNPIIPFSNDTDKYVYTIFSSQILDTTKRTKFINALTNNIQSEYIENSKNFLNIFLSQNWDITFKALKDAEDNSVVQLKSTTEYKTFENFNPLDDNGVSLTNKQRIMNFTTENPYWWINQALKDVYSTVNTNNDINLFNGKKQFNN